MPKLKKATLLIFAPRFGRNVFVGCVVTSASTGSDVMENIVEELTL